MIVNLKQTEMAVLVMHMQIMRASVRNGFKKKYSGQERKEMIESYDVVKREVEDTLSGLPEEDHAAAREIHFNIKELKMLSAFLDFYTAKVKAEIEDKATQVKKMREQDKKQMDALRIIKERVDQVKEDYQVYA